MESPEEISAATRLEPNSSLIAPDPTRVLGKSERTRLALILAAEHLFGTMGIDGVGLRAISEAAQQKNNNAVQYHFGDKLGLLNAILEYREAQLQPLREAMLAKGAEQDRLGDVRWLMRVMFEPNFLLYRDHGGIDYLRLHASYLTTHRPRGVPHPVDTDSPSGVAYRKTIQLLGRRLSFLSERHLWLRLESSGEIFLSAMIQHSVREAELSLPLQELYEDTIEMMAAAVSVPPPLSAHPMPAAAAKPAGRKKT